jgi:hypothetical protein
MRFGSFELNVRSRELQNGARRVRLQEQPFEILLMMLGRRGDLVTRDELLTARLVETASETHLWVETYESYLTDYLSVQTDVAARVARSLAMELIPDEAPAAQPASASPSAYEDYLKGRYYWNMLADQGVEPALVHFEQATRLDPAFALAHVGLARVQLLKAEYYGTTPPVALEVARASRSSARWTSTPISSRLTWRSATCGECSNGTGAAQKRPTRGQSC